MNPSIRITNAPRLGTKVFALAILVSSTTLVPAHSMTLGLALGGTPPSAIDLSYFRAAVEAGALTAEDLAWSDALETESAAAGTLKKLIVTSTGEIEGDVNMFRGLIGTPNNGAAPGQQASGRREVNWDGVPAQLSNGPIFPANFFNSNSTRGLVYQVTTGALEVSNQSFSDIEPAYADRFKTFSGQRLFSPVGTNKSQVQFRVAGTDTVAGVRGFGIVFSGVDVEGSTGIEVLGANGEQLARIVAPVRVDRRGLSFVGVVFRSAVIYSVRIVSGNAALAPGEIDITEGGQHDLVVMDDFIYGDPKAP